MVYVIDTQKIVSVSIVTGKVCYSEIYMGHGNYSIIISFDLEEQAETFTKWIAEAMRNKEIVTLNKNGGIPNDDIVRNSIQA